MTNKQLIEFIKLQISRGINRDIISKQLVGSDWSDKDIAEAFNVVDSPLDKELHSSFITK